MDSTESTGRKTAAESHISFSSPRGSYASFVYSATGERLKATHYTSPIFQGGVAEVNYLTDSDSDASPAGIDPGLLEIAGLTKLEYHGPVVYRNGKVDMVRFPGGYATIKDGAVTFHYYTQDYLGSNRAVVNGTTGAIEQTVAYYPYGGVIANLGISASKQPFKFGGKELTQQNGLNEYDFGARQYYPAVPHFTSPDPLCEKTPHLSPYLYCGNNPVNAFDPDGRSTWVTDSGDGMYHVIGGDLNDKDLNIYVYNKDKDGNYTVRGKSIGKTTSITSFYDSDNGIWSKESIIDTNDKSGIEFLTGIMEDNPPLADYMKDARNNHPYDFKATNGNEHIDPSLDHYRGMPLGKAKDGTPIYSSARDIGNMAAGYIAAANGLSWKMARAGFDTYQSYKDRKPTIEGISTQSAEFYGFVMGYTSNLTVTKNYNLARSLIMAPLTVIKSIFGK
ncbi:MAG: RHS repeat-associated core domain-containing protein [Bacteroides sp.]|nr:RHS repeat-associated core domain-containing protein [Bacteroides sp.]